MLFTSKNTLPINKDNLRSIFLAGSKDYKQEGSLMFEHVYAMLYYYIFNYPTDSRNWLLYRFFIFE